MRLSHTVTNKRSIKRFSTLEEELLNKHNSKYSYDNAVYTKMTSNITITCPTHGDFEQRVADHLAGRGCSKCATKANATNKRVTLEQFIAKATMYYAKYNYDYTNTVMGNNNKDRVEVICPKHGTFKTTVANHIKGKAKCSSCSLEESVGSLWSYSDWEKAAKASKNFEGFSLYVLRCYNDTEEFIKIGKSFTNISKRYCSKHHMPYDFEVIHTTYGSAKFISELEASLKHTFKEHSYVTGLYFPGMYEAFNTSILPALKRALR
jgi:hypothetical protein